MCLAVEVEDVGARCLQLQLVSLYSRLVFKCLLRAGVYQAVLAVERSLSGDISPPHLAHGHSIEQGESFFWMVAVSINVQVFPSVVTIVIAHADVAEEVEIVEGIAHELFAVVTAFKLELFVDVDETAQELHLHAGLTLDPCRRGKSALKDSADASVDKVNLTVDEVRYLDVEAKLGSQIGIELSACIPAIVAHALVEVDAVGFRVVVLDERHVEASDSFEIAIEQAEVSIDVAPCTGTDHDAALRCAKHSQGCSLARTVGLVQAGIGLHRTGITLEEVGNLSGYRGQLSVAGQLIAHTDIAVGTDVDTDNLALEVDELKLTAFVLVGFAEVEVPLRVGQRLALLLPRHLYLQRDGELAHR